MVNIAQFIARKKAEFKDKTKVKREATLKELKQESKMYAEEAKLKQSIAKQKASIRKSKGPSMLQRLSAAAKKSRTEGNFSGQMGGAFGGQPSGRNIHEGVGRNIWRDTGSRSIWDEAPKRNAVKKKAGKQIIIKL